MNVFYSRGARRWVLCAATGMLLVRSEAPLAMAADMARPEPARIVPADGARPVFRLLKRDAASQTRTAVATENDRATIVQTQNTTPSQQSSVQAELMKLYERDGKTPPSMQRPAATGTPQYQVQPRQEAAAPAGQMVAAGQPQYSQPQYTQPQYVPAQQQPQYVAAPGQPMMQMQQTMPPQQKGVLQKLNPFKKNGPQQGTPPVVYTQPGQPGQPVYDPNFQTTIVLPDGQQLPPGTQVAPGTVVTTMPGTTPYVPPQTMSLPQMPAAAPGGYAVDVGNPFTTGSERDADRAQGTVTTFTPPSAPQPNGPIQSASPTRTYAQSAAPTYQAPPTVPQTPPAVAKQAPIYQPAPSVATQAPIYQPAPAAAAQAPIYQPAPAPTVPAQTFAAQPAPSIPTTAPSTVPTERPAFPAPAAPETVAGPSTVPSDNPFEPAAPTPATTAAARPSAGSVSPMPLSVPAPGPEFSEPRPRTTARRATNVAPRRPPMPVDAEPAPQFPSPPPAGEQQFEDPVPVAQPSFPAPQTPAPNTAPEPEFMPPKVAAPGAAVARDGSQPTAAPQEPGWSPTRNRPAAGEPTTADRSIPATEPPHAAPPKTLDPEPANELPNPAKEHERKLRLIAQRRGQPGFKGFCPVVLRDGRDLVDSSVEFQSAFEGVSYTFSSAEAKSRFDQNPARYAPAAGGNDVILLGNYGREVPGSLEFAVWYKDRLHLFSTKDSLESFLETLGSSK